MWLVVLFTNSNEMDIVPDNWMCPGEEEVWLPDGDIKEKVISKMAMKKDEPSKEFWKRLSVRVLYKSDNYLKVRSKLNKAVLTSSLETEQEMRKRFTRKRILPDSGSDSDDSSPSFGKASRRVSKKSSPKVYKDSDSDLEIPSPPRIPTPSSMNGNRSTGNFAPHIPTPSSMNGNRGLEWQPVCQYAAPIPSRNFETKIANSRVSDSRLLTARQMVFSPISTSENSDSLNTVILKQILRSIETLQMTMRDLVDEIRMTRIPSSSSVTVTAEENPLPDGVSLPLQNLEELDCLEDIIKTSDVEVKLIHYLSLIGGATLKSATYNGLKTLLSPSLAMKFSWTGAGKNKISFQNLMLCRTLLTALRKNPHMKETTQDEYRKTVQEFFRTAPDRDGGRKRRQHLTSYDTEFQSAELY